MHKPKKFAALDSSFLLGLEAGDDACSGSIDGLGRHGFFFIVTETVLQELYAIVAEETDQETVRHARNTLIQLTNWGFLAPRLEPIALGVSERVAEEIVCKLMPDGVVCDGLVLAEAAYNGCLLLLTNHKTILSANRQSIQLALINFDLQGVFAVSPSEITAALEAWDAVSKIAQKPSAP